MCHFGWKKFQNSDRLPKVPLQLRAQPRILQVEIHEGKAKALKEELV